MPRAKKRKKVSALVLQGGGALGAYEHGVVKALMGEGGYRPDIVCGVSIGGFSAAVISGSKTGALDGLEQLWEEFTALNLPFVPHDLQVLLTAPYNAGMYTPNYRGAFKPFSTTALFDTKPLYKTLNSIIDFDKLNSKKAPQTIISATNIETGEIEYFSNLDGNKLEDKHIVASGSLPPSFPMVTIGEHNYWDGGLFSNTPLKPALKHLEKLGDSDVEREIIIIELFPQAAETPQNMADVIERMGSLIFQSKISFDKKMIARTTSYIDLIETLDENLEQDNPLRENAAFKQLLGYSKIEHVHRISYQGEENLLGISDFTERTIKRRVNAGYTDGMAHLDRLKNI